MEDNIKPIRSITAEDMQLAASLVERGTYHALLTKTASGYADERFSQFCLVYHKMVGGRWEFMLYDTESKTRWLSKGTDSLTSLKACGKIAGTIIQTRYTAKEGRRDGQYES